MVKPREDTSQISKYHKTIQEVEDRISGIEDTIEDNETTVKENKNRIKLLNQNIQEIQDTMKRPYLRIIEESVDAQLKKPVNIFIKIIEENISLT
jgi:septal ring factor EnvC (AmiA/AmiB activator)